MLGNVPPGSSRPNIVIWLTLIVAVLASGCSAHDRQAASSPTPSAATATSPTGSPPAASGSATPSVTSPSPTPSASSHIVATPDDTRPFSEPRPLAQDLTYGMESPLVRELQVRLKQARYLAVLDVTGKFGDQTQSAVLGFQRDKGLPTTGVVGQLTWDALLPMTHEPTADELNNTDVGPWYTGPSHPGYVMEIQHRLTQIGGYSGPIDGAYNQPTRDAISAFRVGEGLAAGEVMDERAWKRLVAKSRNPRYAELFTEPPLDLGLAQNLDQRCLTGRVVCISKEQKLLSLVVDGQVLLTRESRFARPGYDTPVGDYRVWHMDNETVSVIFGERTPMPYAVFFNRDIAIHFSDDFADRGYDSGSHGCSQLRDYRAAKWLYEQLALGDRVVVY